MKKIYWFTAIIAVILAIAIYMSKSNQPSPASREGLLVSIEAIHQTDNFYDIQVEYPKFPGLADFSAEISDLVSGKISSFKDEARKNWEARRATATPENPVPENPEVPFPFIVEWRPVQMNNKYISFVVHFYSFVGGAHGMNEVRAFNYDFAKNKEITITDYLNSSEPAFESLALLAKKEVTSQLQATGMQIDGFTGKMIEDGTKATPENYKNFNFDYNSLTIYFQQYQAAPGSAGEITVTFFKKTLESNLIKSDYLK